MYLVPTIAASATPTEVTPAVMGLAVIILLQLSQFFFAWRKDMRSSEAVKKGDLVSLKTDLKHDIEAVARDVEGLKKSVEEKLEQARAESMRSTKELHDRATDSAVKTSSIIAHQDSMNQTLISLGRKVDRLQISQNHPRP